MRATLAVASREIAERKLALLGTFLVGLLPLAIPLLPWLGGVQARDVRFGTAQLLSLTITFAFPLVFGATILVSDIAGKRFAFYLSRPLPAVSIWAGKLLAALVISVSGAFLAAIPTLLFDGKRAFAAFDTSGPAATYFLLTTVLLLVGAHTASSMVRLRSAWIVLDFFLAALFAVAIALSLRSLFLARFWDLNELKHSPEWLLWWLAAPLIGALLVASYVQVADGRTDSRRSHGALSATLWGLMALLALPLAGLARWVNAATPRDLVGVYGSIQALPRGTWLSVLGRVRARGSAVAAFLYDTRSGQFIKRPFSEGGDPAFSADGTRAVWLQGNPGFFEWRRTGALRFAALDSKEPAAVVSDVETDVWAQLALSPSGRRLAVLDGNALATYDSSDPAHPRQLMALRVERASRSIVFVGEDTLRLFPRIFNANRKYIAPEDDEIEEISLLSKKSLVTGSIERETLPYLRISADGRYFVGTRDKRLTLHDGRTGALRVTLSENLDGPKLRFLAGGSMAVAGIAGASARLLFFEGEKEPARSVELGAAASVVLGGEVAPGRVAVALSPFRSNDPRSWPSWKLSIVEAASGRIISSADGLVPLDLFSWWRSPVLEPAEAGLPASTLFRDAAFRLIRLDPTTGAETVLLGRSK
jgi:hypothetical protein